MQFKNWEYFVLALLVVLAFYIRMQSAFPTDAGAYFNEIDPYYYLSIGQFFVQTGTVPQWDGLAWAPYPSTHHFDPPLISILGAGAYKIIYAGHIFNPYDLALMQGFYPPIAAAFAVIFIFLLLAVPYGNKIGLIAAALFAFTPRIVLKMAAWESELTPWSIFAILFFYAGYILMLQNLTSTLNEKYKQAIILFTGFALALLIFGTKSGMQGYLVLAGFITFKGIFDYLKGKELTWKFLQVNMQITVICFFAELLMSLYVQMPFRPIGTLILGIALSGYLILLIAKNINKNTAIALSLFVLLALVIPGSFFFRQIRDLSYQVIPNDVGSNIIIEEQVPTSGLFTNAMGMLGLPLRYSSDAGLLEGIPLIILLGLVGLITLIIAYILNDDYLIFFAVIVLPLIFVGVSKEKYLLQLSIAMIIGFCTLMGLIYKSLKYLAYERYAKIILALCLFTVLVTAIPALLVIPVSLGPVSCKNLSASDPLYGIAYYLYCNKIPSYWIDALDWIRTSTPEDARILSFSDYGSWINYIAQRPSVLRGDNARVDMQLEFAAVILDSKPERLINFMREHNSTYVLLDSSLMNSREVLIYQACLYENKTTFVPHQLSTYNCTDYYNINSLLIQGYEQGHIDGFKEVYPPFDQEQNFTNAGVYLPIRIFEVEA